MSNPVTLQWLLRQVWKRDCNWIPNSMQLAIEYRSVQGREVLGRSLGQGSNVQCAIESEQPANSLSAAYPMCRPAWLITSRKSASPLLSILLQSLSASRTISTSKSNPERFMRTMEIVEMAPPADARHQTPRPRSSNSYAPLWST